MIRLKFKKIKAWRPSVGTMIAVLIVGGAVAFAVLQSQVKLTGNSIETDSASLVISQNDSTYSNAATGYAFAHIIPGSQASQTQHLYLRNIGDAPLALKVSAPGAPDNPDNVDLSKVNIILTPYDAATRTPGTPQSFSLQSLIDADAAGGADIDYPQGLAPDAIEEFDIQAAMDADAVDGTGASLTSLDLAFTGVAMAGDN